jgi:hypothetical protein
MRILHWFPAQGEIMIGSISSARARLAATVVLAMVVFAVPALSLDVKNVNPAAKSADQRFWDLGNNTIFDTKTALTWMKKDYWQMEARWVNWYSAGEFAEKMNNKKYGGFTDWRLPTPEEALALYERRKQNNDKDGDKIFIDGIFPKGCGWATWTSSEKGDKAVVVSYKDEGGQGYQDKLAGGDAFIRLVRGPAS